MNSLFILLFFVFIITFTNGQDSETAIVKSLIGLLKEKNVAEHTTETTDIKRGDGFKKFSNIIHHSNVSVISITKEIEHLKNNSIFNGVSKEIKKSIVDALDEINDNIIFKPSFENDMFDLFYTDSNGKMSLARIYIEKIDEGYRRVLTLIDVDFIPANPYVILTYSDSDIFTKSSIQKIEFLPTTINNEHLDFIFRINGNLLSLVNQHQQIN